MGEQLQVLRIQDVEKVVGFKRSQIYSLISKGQFPRQIKLSERSSGWLSNEVSSWLQSRIEQSRHAA